MSHYISPQDPPAFCSGGSLYTIQPGDSLFGLASRFKTTIQTLLTANPGIRPTGLQLGQHICVPTPAPTQTSCPGRLYSVKPGDTFYGIARRLGYPLDSLLAVNPYINPNELITGQVICLPPAPGDSPLAWRFNLYLKPGYDL